MKHIPALCLLALVPGLAAASPTAIAPPTPPLAFDTVVFGGFMTLYDFTASDGPPATAGCIGAACVPVSVPPGDPSVSGGEAPPDATPPPEDVVVAGTGGPGSTTTTGVDPPAVDPLAGVPSVEPTAGDPLAVPEPSTLAAAGLALVLLGGTRSRLLARAGHRGAERRVR